MQDADGNLVLDEADWNGIQWWVDGEPLAGEEEGILVAPGEGAYTVWVTDFHDCPSVQSEAITYVDVQEERVNALWRFGPNPFAGGLTLSVAPEWKGGQAVLRDAAGRIVIQRPDSRRAVDLDPPRIAPRHLPHAVDGRKGPPIAGSPGGQEVS